MAAPAGEAGPRRTPRPVMQGGGTRACLHLGSSLVCHRQATGLWAPTALIGSLEDRPLSSLAHWAALSHAAAHLGWHTAPPPRLAHGPAHSLGRHGWPGGQHSIQGSPPLRRGGWRSQRQAGG